MSPRVFRLATALALAACSAGQATQPAPVQPTAPPPHRMTLAESGIVSDWMDRSVDPCQDFFAYACGRFVQTAEIPPDRSSWSAIQVVVKETQEFLRDVLERAAKEPGEDPVQQKIGAFYAACMDTSGIEKTGAAPLQPYLAIVAKVKDRASAARAIVDLHTRGIFPFFAIGPTQDFADVTQVIAALDQSGIGLPDRDYYLSDEGSLPETRKSYRAHVGRMLALLGGKPAQVEAAVTDILRIETAIAKLQQDKVVRRDPHSIYHRIDRKGLEQSAPAFPWGDYLAALGIPSVTAITVHDPAYFRGITDLLAKEKPAGLRNYLIWTVLDAHASELSEAFAIENYEKAKLLSGVKELPPRWRRCVERVDENLGELLGQSYVAAKFGGDSKPRALELTRAVLAAMTTELDALSWMDAATRTAAHQKLNKMAYLVGFPDSWRKYDFPISRTEHFANMEAATHFELTRQLGKIGKPVDRFDWQMTPPTVNAYYDPTMNELALPAGQLQPPFFGARFHPAVNFGSTGGGTIGHEMTHGFDDEGSQFDADGNLRDWWSPQTKEQFTAAAQCVVDQYAQYEAVPGVKLNGKLTAGENIADIGGVKLGFEGYKAWRSKQATPPPAEVDGLSDAQLYFLAYGQSWCSKDTPQRLETMARSNPHSPPRWRVNGVIVDQPAFGDAFQCAPGTPMRPVNTCTVW